MKFFIPLEDTILMHANLTTPLKVALFVLSKQMN